jgi:hypothetical protein
MNGKKSTVDGISEMVSVALILVLVVALAVVVYSLMSASVKPEYLQKSVYIAGEAKTTSLSSGGSGPYDLLSFLANAGDPFYITGQANNSGTRTTMKVVTPDNRTLTPDASSLKGSLYGRTLYIYQKSSSNACEYGITDSIPDVKTLPKMVTGRYQIQIIDEKLHVLASTYTTDITKGTTSLPATVLMGTGTGTGYRSDCSSQNGSCPRGCPPVYNTSPCNRTYTRFNGSTYLTFADDPTLKYTGDTTISVSIRPKTTGAYSNSNTADWHEIIGKGVTSGVNNEDDNYQLVQMGDRLYFEWNDKTTGTHYHAMTPTGVLTAGAYTQVDVVVQGGKLSIYVDGQSQTLSYYQSNVPGTNPLSTAPTVSLKDNSNAVTVGKQNGDPACYFNGDIGEISLYNRALSAAELSGNACSG